MSTTPPVIETPQPSAAATPVSDKRTAATGVIPKQMQSWIFLAILGVVAVGLWFSSSGQKAKSAGANEQREAEWYPAVPVRRELAMAPPAMAVSRGNGGGGAGSKILMLFV